MRRVAHELAVLDTENAAFRDGCLFHLLQEQIEFVIQDVGKTPWSVARSRLDLRGRKPRGLDLLPRFRPEVNTTVFEARYVPDVRRLPGGNSAKGWKRTLDRGW